MPFFVGCDLGTSGTKAAVVDADGDIVGAAHEAVRLSNPRPGCVEQDLEDIEASGHRTIRRALEAAGRPTDVAGVAFSAQMAGIGSVDAAFRPVMPFDSWLDTRCEPIIVELADNADRIVELSGCPPTYSHGPKMVWAQRHRPDAFRRVSRFVVPHAFVAARLAGLPADDVYIDTGTLSFSNVSDTANARWSEELVEHLGLPDTVLPRILRPLDVIGDVTPAAASATGLPQGTPVVAGAGDQIAAALGAGVVAPGQVYDSAGTASLFAVCMDGFRPDIQHHTMAVFPAVTADTFIAFAFVNGGGLSLQWFCDQLCPDLPAGAAGLAALDAMAAEVDPGANGLLWYPHFQGGVLPPRPRARGGWVGLTAWHDRRHMYRSMLEGIAYEYAQWADLASSTGQPLTEARAIGGGARSTLWNQIKADVLGIDWVPTLRQECAVLGDAIMAATATGHVDDPARLALAWQQTTEPVVPDPVDVARYAEMRQAYAELSDGLPSVYDRLDRARRNIDEPPQG